MGRVEVCLTLDDLIKISKMSKTKMLFFAAITIAAVSCRSFDCSGPAACGGSTASAPRPSSHPFDNNFFKSAFKQSKKRRSAEAQFNQQFYGGSISTHYDCKGVAGCAGAIPNISPNIRIFEPHKSFLIKSTIQ